MNANKTMAFLSELDDDDLLLELDDDDKYRQISNKTLNHNIEKNPDEYLFKIPDLPTSALSSSNSKPSFTLTCKESSNSLLQQTKLFELDSTQICDGFDQRQQSILEDLFENDDKEDDKEDDYIKNQPLFASTQMGTISNLRENFVDSTVKTSTFDHFAPKINSSVIVTTESATEIFSSSKFSSTMNQSLNTNDPCIETHPCWKYAQQDLVNIFRKLQLENEFFKKYNIQYYFKNFFEYDLLSNSQNNNVRKLPLICVCIKEIVRRPTNASVVLSDGIEKVKGTISNNVIKDYWNTLTMNAVLLLEDVSLLRINYNKNGYHLNINLHNIVIVYYPNLEEPVDQINKLELKQLNKQKINASLNEFRKKYVEFEIKSSEKPTLNSNKSSISIISTDFSNNLSNNRNRPAPYTVPNRDNQNKITHFSSNDRLHDQKKEKTTETIHNDQPMKPNVPNINNNIKTNNLNHIPAQNKNTNHRSFNFVNRNKPGTQAKSSLNINNTSTSNTLSESNAFSSQRQLSEEVLSQLIFGIEDELLNDDDL